MHTLVGALRLGLLFQSRSALSYPDGFIAYLVWDSRLQAMGGELCVIPQWTPSQSRYLGRPTKPWGFQSSLWSASWRPRRCVLHTAALLQAFPPGTLSVQQIWGLGCAGNDVQSIFGKGWFELGCAALPPAGWSAGWRCDPCTPQLSKDSACPPPSICPN